MSLLLASLAVLAGGAILSLVLSGWPRGALLCGLGAIVVAAGVSGLAALGVLLTFPFGPVSVRWSMPLGQVMLGMDGLSAWFVLTIALLGAAVAVYSWSYFDEEGTEARRHEGTKGIGVFASLMCLLVACMLVVACAADVVLFLIGWEMMTLTAFFLVMFHHRQEEVRRAGWLYLIATHLGTALCVLPMFTILVAKSGGETEYSRIASGLSLTSGWAALIFVLGLIGFGTKAGFMPMHVWLPVAHPVAPTPVSALLSGVVIKTGIYGILRMLTWLPPLPLWCGLGMLMVGAISGVLGVLYALAQHDLKRLLAYHSVENIGIIGLGIGIGMLGQRTGMMPLAVLGYAGALLHVLNHALFKGLLFLSAGAVIHSTGTGAIDRLGGLAKHTPLNAWLFLIAAVAICGLPPLNGFVSEWLIYIALFRGAAGVAGSSAAGSVIGLTALALMGGLALACFSKVFGVVFLGNRRDESLPAHATPWAMIGAMTCLAGACLAIGLLPSLAIYLTGPAVGTLTKLNPAVLGAAVSTSVSSAAMISLLAMVFLAVAAGLLFLRNGIYAPWGRRLWKVAPAAAQPVAETAGTWGCGYTQPSPRVQYTSSSFAWSLITSFAAVLWPHRRVHEPHGAFPTTGHLHSDTPDLAYSELFTPLFSGVARLCAMIKMLTWSGEEEKSRPEVQNAEPVGPLRWAVTRAVGAVRRGGIHICLTYIVITLVTVFVIEAVNSPRPARNKRGVVEPVPTKALGEPSVRRKPENQDRANFPPQTPAMPASVAGN